MSRYLYALMFCCIFIMYHGGALSQENTILAYTSLKNLKKNNSQKLEAIEVISPINTLHFSNEQNEYYFYKKHHALSLFKFLKDYVALQYQDTLYMNMERLRLGNGFSKVLTKGRYWVVVNVKVEYNDNADNIDLAYNKSSGLYEVKHTNKIMRQYMYYAIDSTNFEKIPLTFAGMLKILSYNHPLQMQFVKDKYNDEPSIMLLYIQELNRYIDYFESQHNE